MCLHNSYPLHKLTRDRFVDTETWRKEIDLDDLVRNFDYAEKPQVFEYYPQYYHKTDKVRYPHQPLPADVDKKIGWTTGVHRATGQH